MHSFTLPFDREKIERITKTFPTPFYLYDERGIIDCVERIKQAFSWNEGYREYFAVKATPNPAIIRLLNSLGCGVDCASTTELTMSKKLGITGQNIMFSSNDTPKGDYILARELGAIINLDDCSHIDFLAENGGIPETICMRYNPGTDFIVQNDIMGELKQSKFGMTKAQLINSVKRLSEMGAKNFGVHAMLASCALDENYYPTLAREVFSLALEIKKETGVSLSFVNLSGGIGIPYRPEETPVDIIRIGQNVKAVYDELIAANGMKLSLFTEMGRFVTGPYGYLISTVLHEKETYKKYLGLDATACNLMRPAIYGAYHHVTILGKEEAECDTLYDVVGSLCENNDKFAVDRMLPKAEIGDIAVIHDAGAHGYSMGYNYNGKLKCAELLLERGGNVRIIRRAETMKDYFATLDIFPEFR
ncbi:MAG: diaminopimelate decarboxylase [Ruminococcus sp.]|nr:diaminopimelate decarboxylase [Ruminococcus sp.]